MTSMIGYGLTFGIYNGSTYDNVAEVTSCTPPGYSRDAVETTHMTSTSKHRTYIPGLIDAGEVSIEFAYDPSASDAMITALTASTLGQFKITMPDAVTCVFSAVVTSYQPGNGITPDGKMTASATFKVSGVPTWA